MIQACVSHSHTTDLGITYVHSKSHTVCKRKRISFSFICIFMNYDYAKTGYNTEFLPLVLLIFI